jgi:hypothetical protein
MELITSLVGIAFMALLPLIPFISLIYGLRHGPVRNRWWRGETVGGFTLVIGGAAFAFGFFGPLIWAPDANQGPLLGIFITGPAGFVIGLLWGLLRAARRRRAESAGA